MSLSVLTLQPAIKQPSPCDELAEDEAILGQLPLFCYKFHLILPLFCYKHGTMRIIFITLLFLIPCSGITQTEPITKTTHQYAVVDGEQLSFDLYKSGKNQSKPTFIWMHGGGFSGGSRDNDAEVRFMNELAANNYNAISISYRLLQKGKEEGFGCDCAAERKELIFREAAGDFLRAVQYTASHAKELGIDTSTLIVGGSSAGAEAVLNAVYNANRLFDPAEHAMYSFSQSVQIDGVVSLAGALLDARYIPKHAPPAIFFHGTADNLVPYATAPHHYCDENKRGYLWLDGSATIAEQLANNNQSYVLATYPEARHEISGIPFNEMEQLLQWMDALFIKKEAIQLMLEKQRE